ncbi:MAG: PBP1A family penicillin-binding protein [Parvularculaceae bacterium]
MSAEPNDASPPPGARQSPLRGADPLLAGAAAAMDRAGAGMKAAGALVADRAREFGAKAGTLFARENPMNSDLPPATPPPPRKTGAPKAAAKPRTPKARAALVLDAAASAFSLGAVGLLGFLFAAFVVLAPRPAGDADLWAVNRLPSIVILDRNGEELAARGARYGQQVSVAELPPYLVKAIVATEDRRFFEHRGVDFRGSLRALLANLRAGRVVEGGSTITQQLARNLFLSFDQNYTRKAREALLALWIEGRYTKEQILSIYLNRIYFGAGAYGIDSAARTYFGKSARDVSLAEAVMLAGLPKAPSQLAPTLNPGGAQNRADEVLQNLRETGAISEFEARDAVLHPAVVASGENNTDVGWFFDYIAEKARGLIGGAIPSDIVVTTTIDRRMQRLAEGAIKSAIGVDAKTAGAEQAALIAYDVNGGIRAMVGGRSYLESQFNRATQALRQPGSAFKPIVYAAALESGVTPDSVFVDQPVDIDGWKPENYTPGYQGRMRLTEAVAKSINTIAVQISEQIGRASSVEMARRLGIKSHIEPVASIALGGISVTLEELAAAYIPFADNGWGPEPYAIERIENQSLELIYERPALKPRRAIAEETAEGMTHLLYQVMSTGTGAGARLSNRDAAGKTGTTNDWRDAWFVGYTAQLVAGVWVGNDDFTPMQKVTGGTIPARIWKEFMVGAHQDLPRLPLKGAYPAATYADESQLLMFYSDVSEGLRDVRRDGDWRDGSRRRR